MSLLGTRRAAEQLHRVLEGDTPAGADTRTAALLVLGERLRDTGTRLEQIAVPREDFRAALRTRLVAVATIQAATVQATTVQAATVQPERATSGLLGLSARSQKAAGVAAGALASVVAVSGVAVASTQALPGDPFYGVKRTAEDLQLRLAGGDAAQGDRHLQFAATRLDEVRALTVGRDVELSDIVVAPQPGADWRSVRETLADMDAETRLGSALLERVWREDGDADVLTALSDFASTQSAELSALMLLMPAEARVSAEASLGLVAEVGQTTSALLGSTCTQACEPGASPSQPGTGGACECADGDPSAPQPAGSGAPSPSDDPATGPTAPAPTGSAPDGPAPTGSPAPSPDGSSSPRPLPTLPTPSGVPSSLPSTLPTTLPTGSATRLPTVAPSLPLSPAPLPVPSGDLPPDDLVPGG